MGLRTSLHPMLSSAELACKLKSGRMYLATSGTRACAASRTLVLLCSALPHSPPLAVGRRAILHGAAAAVAVPVLLIFPTVASADAVDVIVSGRMQHDIKLPPGATATITARVVGRNSKGPLATVVMSDLGPSPVDFVITRADLREVPDFVWLDQDLYIKVEVAYNDKPVLVGRGKAKAVEGQAESIDTRHTKPLVDLSRV